MYTGNDVLYGKQATIECHCLCVQVLESWSGRKPED